MNYLISCWDCKISDSIPLPLPPPVWPGGGGGVTPPDPTLPYVYCPTIPSTILAGSADASVRVLGQNFVNGTHVVWMNGVSMATTFVSATELSFIATHSDRTTAGVETIEVRDGTTVIQAVCQFTYTAAALMTVICPPSPATARVNWPNMPVTINGTGFTATCQVQLNGLPQTTVSWSPTQITFTVQPSTHAVGIETLTVVDTATAVTATGSCPFEFLVALIVPTVNGLFPDMVGKMDPPKTVTVTGFDFAADSVITMNYFDDIATTFVDANTLTCQTPTSLPSTVSIGVMNGGVRTNQSVTTMPFTCVNQPVLNELVPATIAAGGPDITLKVLGQNFGNTARIMIDGAEVPTAHISSGSLTTTISPAAGGPRTIQVAVRLGHPHGTDHDNVWTLTPPSLPFVFS